MSLKPILVPAGAAKIFMQKMRPNCHLLYSAGWRSGFTVNGIPASA